MLERATSLASLQVIRILKALMADFDKLDFYEGAAELDYRLGIGGLFWNSGWRCD